MTDETNETEIETRTIAVIEIHEIPRLMHEIEGMNGRLQEITFFVNSLDYQSTKIEFEVMDYPFDSWRYVFIYDEVKIFSWQTGSNHFFQLVSKDGENFDVNLGVDSSSCFYPTIEALFKDGIFKSNKTLRDEEELLELLFPPRRKRRKRKKTRWAKLKAKIHPYTRAGKKEDAFEEIVELAELDALLSE